MARCHVFTDQEIASFRRAGTILADCLAMLRREAKAGVKTIDLDVLAESFIRSKGGLPAFKGYNDFPYTICTSINDECVHGMPGERVLKDGDIASLDCGVIIDGLYTDAAITVPVGIVSADARRVIEASEAAMQAVLPIIRAGVRVGDISSCIEKTVHGFKCEPVRSLTGHGLGRTLHLFPDIPNLGKAGSGAELPAGTVVAIEPIVALGKGEVVQAPDGWTLKTVDGSLSSHTEHTILVTTGGCEVLA